MLDEAPPRKDIDCHIIRCDLNDILGAVENCREGGGMLENTVGKTIGGLVVVSFVVSMMVGKPILRDNGHFRGGVVVKREQELAKRWMGKVVAGTS